MLVRDGRLTVHDFRRVAATSIAEYDPAHAGIIRDVLGHATMDMADRYYNQARSLEAMEKLQEVMEAATRPGAAKAVTRKMTRTTCGDHGLEEAAYRQPGV